MKTKLILLFFVCITLSAVAQWKPTNGLYSGELHSVIVSNNEIIVGTRYIYKSTNNGKTWFVSNNGINGTVSSIRGFAKISTYLVAATDAGAFYSTDNGNNWTQCAGTASLNIWSIVVKGSNLFISTDANGIYKSTNNGIGWSAVNTGITTPLLEMRALAVKGTDLYAGTDGYGIFKSTNDGATWATVNSGLPGNFYAISSIVVAGSNIIAGTYGAGVYKSVNDGATWTGINSSGISSSDNILGMGLNGTSVYAGTFTGSLYKTTDYVTWNAVAPGPFMTTRYEAYFSLGSDFYVGCWGAQSTEKSFGVFKTSDDGNTWQHIGITDYPVSALEISGSNVLGGTNDITGNSFRTSLFKTTEADTTWAISLGGVNTKNITAMKANGAIMYLFDDEGPGSAQVYRSTNNGLNWTSTGFNVLYSSFSCFAIAGSIVYAGDNASSSSHIYVSSDNGATFTAVNSGIPTSVHYVYGLTLKGTTLFAATDAGVYKNTVSANNWTAVNSGLTNLIIKSIYASGSTLYAGTQGGGIFKSTNDGALWTESNIGIPLFTNVTCFSSSGSNVYAGTDNGVYVSGNSGTSWGSVNMGLTDSSITALVASANYLWAGTTSQGVWRRDLSQLTSSVPATPGAISGSATVCSESSNTYSVAPVSGATSYTWTLPGGWIGSSTNNSITAIAGASGSITVTANNGFGSSAPQTLNITVNTVNTSVSQSGFTFTANATGATYVWINCNGNAPIPGQTQQSFTATAIDNYAVIVTQNGCPDTSACLLADTNCYTSMSGADLPYSGLSALLSVDTISFVSVGNPGASQSWNYLFLTPNYPKFAVYNSTSTTPYASAFPASNIYTYGPSYMFGSLFGSAPVGTNSNGYMFWKSDSTGLWVTGFRSEGGLAAGINVIENPKELLIGVPAVYGSVFNNSARWELPLNQVASNVDTFYVRTIKKVITVDACGSITTPYTLFSTVLREHEYVISVDSVYMKLGSTQLTALELTRDTLNNYIYLANSMGYPVCIVHADKNNSVLNVEYYSGQYSGIEDKPIAGTNVSVYPNPSNGRITIEIPQENNKMDNQIYIYNSLGSLVWQKNTSDTKLNIDISNYPKGMYFIKVANGGNIKTEKLVIQ
ncbi:MAG: T9SS type A sorting domain-containing protein [Bacteroidota bacterium]